MKRILLILLMMGGIAYGQCPEVTGLSVSNLSTTGGKATYTAAVGATLYVWGIYVPGGAFVTGGSTTSTTFNFTGLTASTTYRLKVRTTCGLSVSGDDSLTFSTLSATAMYTPLTAQGYQIKYLKVDSGFNLPLRDTALLRGIDQAGAQVYKPGSGVFVYTGSYWQGISGGNGTIIITDTSTGLAYISFNGYSICQHFIDSTFSCHQMNTFFDDVRLSDDSLWYKFYNDGTVIDSVPSGIKNVGAVWPISYNGTDLTISQHYFDSLYVASLVKHGDSLFSKRLNIDSSFIGLMSGSGGGGSGITKVGSPAYGLTRTNDSTYIVDTTVIQSKDGVNLTARAAISLTTTGTSGAATYSSSTGVLNVPQYTSSSGTVTSVATGYGLSGGTITTAGTLLLDSALLSLTYLRRADSTGNTGYAQIWKQNKALTTVTALNDSTLRFTTFGGTNYDATIVGSNYWSKLGNNIYRPSYNVGIGTSSPSARLTIRSDSLNNVIDTTGGISIQNKKAATSGVPQFSGTLIFEGQGYASTPATSMSARMILYNAISSSGSTPSQSFNIASSINNAAPTTIFQLSQAGNVILAGSLSSSFISGTNVSMTSTYSSSLSTAGAFANSNNVYGHTGTFGNSGTAGTVTINGFYDAPTINTTGGTSVYRSLYSNISTTSTTGATVLAYENTNYNNLLNTSSGATGVGVSSNASMAASAKLQINSTTQGFLPPRMTSTQASAISSPAEGLLVYVTDTNATFTAKGWWGYDGATWLKLNN